MKLKVLLACEESQTLAEQFTLLGHDALSCDLFYPGAKGLPHYRGDVRDILFDGWDLMIGHPPCTRLTNVVFWYVKKHGLYKEVEEAAEFFNQLLDAPIDSIGLENPIPSGYARKFIRKYDQIIQPYQFGDDASKSTCLWLKNLPPLVKTGYVEPRIVNGLPRWGNQTNDGRNNIFPDNKSNPGARARERSKTFPGIARAIAEQWSAHVIALKAAKL